jgi:hypothetical protein
MNLEEETIFRALNMPCPYCGNGIHFWQKWGQVIPLGLRIHVGCAQEKLISVHRGGGELIRQYLEKNE